MLKGQVKVVAQIYGKEDGCIFKQPNVEPLLP